MTTARHPVLAAAAERYGSQAALAAQIGVRPTVLGAWINQARTPYRSSLTRDIQRRLFSATGRTVDELWPAPAVAEPVQDGRNEPHVDAPPLTELALQFTARNTLPNPEEVAALADDCDLLNEALATLTAKQRAVVMRHFGLSGTPTQTLRQIGGDLGCTAESVRQTEQKALARMRHYFEHPVGRRLVRRQTRLPK